jgi:hypothetical protein
VLQTTSSSASVAPSTRDAGLLAYELAAFSDIERVSSEVHVDT